MMKHYFFPSDLKFGAIEFDKVKVEDFLPALKYEIAEAKKKIAEYKNMTDYSFKSVFVNLSEIEERVHAVVSVFYTLFYAHSTPELQNISQEFSQLLTEFESDLSLDANVFKRIKSCYDNISKQKLTTEEKTIVEQSYKGFVRNGALLNEADKKKLKEIDMELSQLSVNFNQNSLKATNAYKLFVSDKNKLKGIPDSVLSQASELAKKEGKEGQWCFSLQAPSINPFLKYCQDRELRKTIAIENGTRATKGEFNNQENVKKQVRLRNHRAKLLGYKSHAHFVLEMKMATTPQTVNKFIDDLFEKSLPFAKKDIEDVKAIAKKDGIYDIQSWDFSYYEEKLKMEKLKFDDEELKPYLKVENVLEGMYKIADFLYDLEFHKKTDYPVYHPEVEVFEVYDKNKKDYLGLFYVDLFPRETKSSGAWMMSIRNHGFQFGKMRKPLVSITCNFTPSTADKPSMLNLDEVTTLFHEFGHALHGLLSQCQYTNVSGTNVYHDFVELPSQIMENWVTQKECLDLFAKHYVTGKKIPAELIEKVKQTKTFMEGYFTMRQVSFGLLDMAWHGEWNENDFDKLDVIEFENKAMNKAMLIPRVTGSNMSCMFGHLFAGGYSAGYYGYKWAEVLDADAFEMFLENGIFDKKTAKSFREHILEKGGSEHPMDLYKRFRGKEPTVDALIKRAGFLLN